MYRRLLEPLPNLRPRLAEGPTRANVRFELVVAIVEFARLLGCQRQVGRIAAQSLPDSLQEVELLSGSEGIEIDRACATYRPAGSRRDALNTVAMSTTPDLYL